MLRCWYSLNQASALPPSHPQYLVQSRLSDHTPMTCQDDKHNHIDSLARSESCTVQGFKCVETMIYSELVEVLWLFEAFISKNNAVGVKNLRASPFRCVRSWCGKIHITWYPWSKSHPISQLWPNTPPIDYPWQKGDRRREAKIISVFIVSSTPLWYLYISPT